MRSIFLAADSIDSKIQDFRLEHDPLGKLIEPHVTLVFPFESELSDRVILDHIAKVVTLQFSFSASLAPKPIVEGSYIYFPIHHGIDRVIELHDQLYLGVLAGYLRTIPYRPHVTVARAYPADSDKILRKAQKLDVKSEFTISTVKLEHIRKNGKSEVIECFQLATPVMEEN